MWVSSGWHLGRPPQIRRPTALNFLLAGLRGHGFFCRTNAMIIIVMLITSIILLIVVIMIIKPNYSCCIHYLLSVTPLTDIRAHALS